MIGVALFVYRRPEMTQMVLDSIRENGFEKIYIFQDGLGDKKYEVEWKKVNKIIRSIDYLDVEVHVSDYNKGLACSITDGMNYVFERHDRALALEDDVLLSKSYKRFVEECFELYENDDEVTSVCGVGNGTIIPEDYPYDVYFCHRMSSPGFGTWKKYWQDFRMDIDVYWKVKRDPQKSQFLQLAGNDIEKMVHFVLEGKKIQTWALYWTLYQIDLLSYQAIPLRGLAKNMGLGGGGTNIISKNSRLSSDFVNEISNSFFMPSKVLLDERIIRDTQIVMDYKNDSDRYGFYSELYYNWIKMLQKGISISQAFIQSGIKEAYIYGGSKVGDLFLREVQESINIVGFVVEKKDSSVFCGIQVYEVGDRLLDGVPIIVLPAFDIDYIIHTFKKFKVNNSIIRIDSIINSTVFF